MTSEAFEYTQQLWLLYSQQLVVLERLFELCELQSRTDLNGDDRVLTGYLARKQPLMDEIACIQQQLMVYADDDPESRVWYSASEREQCRQMADRCQSLLRQILVLEQQAIDCLSQRRDAIACQLQEGRDRLMVRSLYQSDSDPREGALDLDNI